jgi:thymidylate synthase
MKKVIDYKPLNERTPDDQYERLIEHVLENGKSKAPIHARLDENKGSGHATCIETSGYMLSYDMTNGFPLINGRDMSKSFAGSIGELIGFINGARTLDELVKFGCPKVFWERWVTKEKCDIWGLQPGNLGPGSYGPTLRSIHAPPPYMRYPGHIEKFDQIMALDNVMRKYPEARTLMITTWNPPYALGDDTQGFPRKVVVAPCHGTTVQFNLFPELGEMEVVQTQRSADICVGLPINLVEWATFGYIMAYLHGYKFTKYVHFLPNPQIYDVQIESAKKLISQSRRKLPTVEIDIDSDRAEQLKRPWDFRKTDFSLSDYNPYPFFKIPTAI